jgi:hypothetical protein
MGVGSTTAPQQYILCRWQNEPVLKMYEKLRTSEIYRKVAWNRLDRPDDGGSTYL